MTLVGALAATLESHHRPLLRRAGLNYWSIIITICITEIDCHTYPLCIPIYRSFSFILGTYQYSFKPISQQKSLGVGHNSPQMDNVPPWSIQLSKNDCLMAVRERIPFKYLEFYFLSSKKLKRTDLPSLYKGKSAPCYKVLNPIILPKVSLTSSIYCFFSTVWLDSSLSFQLQHLIEFHHWNTSVQ